jgi:cell division protein FtsQ
MNFKRKISVRKVLQLSLTVVAGTACVIAILSASSMRTNKKLAGVDIRIKNDQYHFIDKGQVMDMLFRDRNINPANLEMKKLDANQMERILDSNPWVADAQVYVDNKQQLHISLTQRVPVARLFEQNGNSYYLDHTLKQMPLSDKYIHYTTVVTNVPLLKDDSASNAMKGEIVALVKHIDRDTFWSAQVSQVIVTDDRKFELVPVLGNHRILFGDTTGMNNKFNNLFAFYKKILNKIGWDKYEVLDIRFDGQVVASPALPWKKPADNAMANMNWVKSIIGNDPKPAESDTTNVIIANTIVSPTLAAANKSKPVTPPAVSQAPAQPVQKAEPKPAQPTPAVKKPEPKPVPQRQAQASAKQTTEKKQTNNKENNKEKKSNEQAKYIYQGN